MDTHERTHTCKQAGRWPSGESARLEDPRRKTRRQIRPPDTRRHTHTKLSSPHIRSSPPPAATALIALDNVIFGHPGRSARRALQFAHVPVAGGDDASGLACGKKGSEDRPGMTNGVRGQAGPQPPCLLSALLGDTLLSSHPVSTEEEILFQGSPAKKNNVSKNNMLLSVRGNKVYCPIAHNNILYLRGLYGCLSISPQSD